MTEQYSFWFDLSIIGWPRRIPTPQEIICWLDENNIVYDKKFMRIKMLRLNNKEDVMAFTLRWL